MSPTCCARHSTHHTHKQIWTCESRARAPRNGFGWGAGARLSTCESSVGKRATPHPSSGTSPTPGYSSHFSRVGCSIRDCLDVSWMRSAVVGLKVRWMCWNDVCLWIECWVVVSLFFFFIIFGCCKNIMVKCCVKIFDLLYV